MAAYVSVTEKSDEDGKDLCEQEGGEGVAWNALGQDPGALLFGHAVVNTGMFEGGVFPRRYVTWVRNPQYLGLKMMEIRGA